MLRGVAVGGPRDRIMLEAGRHWLGMLERHLDGRYVWDESCMSWVWTSVDEHFFKKVGASPMARKSAHMLKVGMTVLIDGHSQMITDIVHNDDNQLSTIICGKNVYRRTFGIKVDVISRGKTNVNMNTQEIA